MEDTQRSRSISTKLQWIAEQAANYPGRVFTSLAHLIDVGLLREIIKQRVKDGGILRLIGKWLNAGVLDGEELYYPEKGTPQGGVMTPFTQKVISNLNNNFH